jgi:metallo-beta-lactamase family protein
MRLTFLGAAETVTGSKLLVESSGTRVLVDCGLFQGVKNDRQRNREPFPFDPGGLDAVLLTHAHLDHSGMVPLLVKRGFRGPVWCTAGTAALVRVLWPDSGRLQEEDARWANERGFSKHHPAEPLYTADDAARALQQLAVVPRGATPEDALTIGALRARWTPAGHILGASSVHLEDDETSVLVSGDLGRPHDPLMRAPAVPPAADHVIVESTYGGRRHAPIDVSEALAAIITRTAERGGVVLIPAFAVGRAQLLAHLLTELRDEGRIPGLPIALDSPMAIDVTELYLAHSDEHRLDRAQCGRMGHVVEAIRDPMESRHLIDRGGPRVVISASGMATGGRVLHHLRRVLPDPRHTVLLVGFQATGTRGEALASGAPSVKIHGEHVRVAAEVIRLDGLSAHADGEEVLDWLERLPRAPRVTYVVHGEPGPADSMRRAIQDRLGWRAVVPRYGMTVELKGIEPKGEAAQD